MMIEPLPNGHPIVGGHYTAWTPPMRQLANYLQGWLFGNSVGAVVIGLGRIGKTTAVRSILPKLRTRHGNTVPSVFYPAKQQTIKTDAKFWESMAFCLGLPRPDKGNAGTKYNRVVGCLIDAVGNNELQKLVLVVDEAQRLRTAQYELLTDLYNDLDLIDIRLSVILIGSPQMKEILSQFSAPNAAHIRGRFLRYVYEYRGISSESEMRGLLAQYDTDLVYPPDSARSYTAAFLPSAFADGFRLSSLAPQLWKGFRSMRKSHHYRDYPMEFLSDTIGKLLQDYLPRLATPAQVSDEIIEDAIISGGLICNVRETQEIVAK